jgi:uncharacterized protein YndB with AHSA1/START domain
MSDEAATTQIYRIYIKATPQAVWDAITRPEWTQRYGLCTAVEFDLRPGGAFRHPASAGMIAMGLPETAFVGEVVEADPPHRLVQTMEACWDPLEGLTRLTYEIDPGPPGVSVLTVRHELEGAPSLADMVAGRVEGAGGGWSEVLSEIKTLLETGAPLKDDAEARGRGGR